MLTRSKLKQIAHCMSMLFIAGCAREAPLASSIVECSGLPSPCLAQGDIVVLAERSIAEPILATATLGAQKFQHYFDAAASPIAIVPGGVITADLRANLKQAGYNRALPWITAEDKRALQTASIRKQILAQTEGKPQAVRDAVLAQALGQMESQTSNADTLGNTEAGALTHELGHMWFMEAFASASQGPRSAHGYGGWAPDWLDEASAILLENETLTISRRNRLLSMSPESLPKLRDFFTMEHPALESALALAAMQPSEPKNGESRAIVLSGDEAQAFLKASGGADPLNFYTQTRAVIDFLIATSGDDLIISEITKAYIAGETIESWLTAEGDKHALPQSLTALEDAWQIWLAEQK